MFVSSIPFVSPRRIDSPPSETDRRDGRDCCGWRPHQQQHASVSRHLSRGEQNRFSYRAGRRIAPGMVFRGRNHRAHCRHIHASRNRCHGPCPAAPDRRRKIMIKDLPILLRGDVEKIALWLRQPHFRSLVGYLAIILIGTGHLRFHARDLARAAAIVLHRDQISAPDFSHLRRQRARSMACSRRFSARVFHSSKRRSPS